MRLYGAVHTSFWENSNAQQLSDQAKLLAIYLLTGPHTNMIGCFRLPYGYIMEDLRWDVTIVKVAFQELATIQFLTRDEQSAWLTIHHFIKWNPIQNPRQGIGVQKLFCNVSLDSTVYQPLIKGLLTYGKYLDKKFHDHLQRLANRLETGAKYDMRDQDQNQNQDQDNIMSGKPDVDLFNENILYPL